MKQVNLFKVRKRTGDFIPDKIGVRVRKRRRVHENEQISSSALELSTLTLNEERKNEIPGTRSQDGFSKTGAMEYVLFRRVQLSDPPDRDDSNMYQNGQLGKSDTPHPIYSSLANNIADVPVMRVTGAAPRMSRDVSYIDSQPNSKQEESGSNARVDQNHNSRINHRHDGGYADCGGDSANTYVLFARESYLKSAQEDMCHDGEIDRINVEETKSGEKEDGRIVNLSQQECGFDKVPSAKGKDSSNYDVLNEKEDLEIERTVYVDEEDVFGDGWYVGLEDDSDDYDEDAEKRLRGEVDDNGSDLDARTVDYPSTPEEFSEDEDELQDGNFRGGYSSDGGDMERYDQFVDEYDSEC